MKDDEEFESDDSKGEFEDDKDTRLTLMEQILLLGLKDREVSLSVRDICQELF